MENTLTQPAIASGLSPAKARAGLRAEEFDQLVRLNQRRIFRLLMTLLRDADAADTLTQECFLRAYRTRASFRGECKVETWLARIAVNLATDHARSRRVAFWKRLFAGGSKEEADRMAGVAAPAPSLERATMARQEAARVWSAAEQLPEKQRAVFLLRFAEEMSLAEIADALELEEGTVKAHLHRAVSSVRKMLRPSEST